MRGSLSNHQPHDCLLNRLFGRRSMKTSMFRVTGLCAGNSPGTGEFPAQMASDTENVSIWWRLHDSPLCNNHYASQSWNRYRTLHLSPQRVALSTMATEDCLTVPSTPPTTPTTSTNAWVISSGHPAPTLPSGSTASMWSPPSYACLIKYW